MATEFKVVKHNQGITDVMPLDQDQQNVFLRWFGLKISENAIVKIANIEKVPGLNGSVSFYFGVFSSEIAVGEAMSEFIHENEAQKLRFYETSQPPKF